MPPPMMPIIIGSTTVSVKELRSRHRWRYRSRRAFQRLRWMPAKSAGCGNGSRPD